MLRKIENIHNIRICPKGRSLGTFIVVQMRGVNGFTVIQIRFWPICPKMSHLMVVSKEECCHFVVRMGGGG